MLNHFFKLDRLQTSVKTECIAGCTTFLTMAYILLVNPVIMSQAGIDPHAAFVATALTVTFGTLLCGLLSNLPVAIAPGMGLNAYFSFVVVQSMGFSWQEALGMVFIAGIIFLILTFLRIRQWIIDSIPSSLHAAISAGIGLFIALIALKVMGVVVGDATTLVKVGALTSPSVLLGFLGFCLIVVLDKYGFRGAIVISIIFITILSNILGYSQLQGFVDVPPSLAPTFLHLDIDGAILHKGAVVILTFLLVALFDSTGTLVGLFRKTQFSDASQQNAITKALFAEGAATTAGALLGTSTTSPYIESAAGIQAGGRSGLTACVVAALFLLALFFAPLAESVPPYAYAPALLFVACKMFDSVTSINWQEMTDYIPSILTIILIPLTFSIAVGIAIGFVAFVILNILTWQWVKIRYGLVILALVSGVFLAFANMY